MVRVVAGLVGALVATLLVYPVAPSSAGTTRAASSHMVGVTGEGVSMFPDFEPGIARYAVTTTDDTAGAVTVTVSDAESDATVRVNGLPLEGPSVPLTGLESGDEISVLVDDSTGRSVYSLVYLPSGFPEIERMATDPARTPSPGHVLLTLGLWTQPSAFFETAVDANGVPAYVREVPQAMDLKQLPNGHYSVARNQGGVEGEDIIELDEQFREVRRYRTVGLQNTDGHDALVLPDGSRYLMAYEPNDETGKVDAIIQHVSAAGVVLFEWNSKDHVDIASETVVGDDPDYAHVNSIDLMDNNDLLVSFRHFSSVFRIAREAHDGFEEGDVIWKLGGRASDFTFVDTEGEPDSGPCAQHTATELANGDIMVFDNGAWSANPLCVDATDPAGAPVDRVPTRIAVWSLNEVSGVATMVRDVQLANRYAIFAGSAQPLPDSRILIGWASSKEAIATEVDENGDVTWEIRAAEAPEHFTYRAFKAVVPDAIAPRVRVQVPARKEQILLGERVRSVAECTDRGGSNLQSCWARRLDTSSLGRKEVRVTARDGAGNLTTVRRVYHVVARNQPDASLRSADARRYVGVNEFGARPRQMVTRVIRSARGSREAVVRVRNVGLRTDRFSVHSRSSSSAMDARLRFPEGRSTSPRLAPGATWTFRVVVTRRDRTRDGADLTERIVTRSLRDNTRHDVVWFRVRAR